MMVAYMVRVRYHRMPANRVDSKLSAATMRNVYRKQSGPMHVSLCWCVRWSTISYMYPASEVAIR